MVSGFTTLQNYREKKFKIKNILHELPIIDHIGIACINYFKKKIKLDILVMPQRIIKQ
jgi:GrpB-like predicted nucleotidyltransferase (UPF0157 family)